MVDGERLSRDGVRVVVAVVRGVAVGKAQRVNTPWHTSLEVDIDFSVLVPKIVPSIVNAIGDVT